MHIHTLDKLKENVISSISYYRSLMAHVKNMFMPRYGTNRLVYKTREIKMAMHRQQFCERNSTISDHNEFSEVILKKSFWDIEK